MHEHPLSYQMAAGEAGVTHHRLIKEDRAGEPNTTLPTSSCRDPFCLHGWARGRPGGVLCFLPTTLLSSRPSFSALLQVSQEGKSLSGGTPIRRTAWLDGGKYCSLIPESPIPYLTALGGARKDSTSRGHQIRCPSVWNLGKRHRSVHNSSGVVFPPRSTRGQGSALYPMGDISTNPPSRPGGPSK